LLGSSKPSYRKRSVKSKDGTTIGFRQFGSGPGLVIQHGGALSSQHYMQLGAHLADEFTICLPDRRGRGMSGPYGPNYSIEREDEDLAAVIDETGAPYVFGAADGGLFALHASMKIPRIRRVAMFEAVLFAGQPGVEEFREVVERGQRLVETGNLAGAMASLAKDAQDYSGESVSTPYRMMGRVLAQPAVCEAFLWWDAQTSRGDDVPLRELIKAWKSELDLVIATEGTLDEYRKVTAEVLLMCGSHAPSLFTGTADALQSVLPHSKRVDLPGVNHGAAQDQGGKPALIADQLRRFFGATHKRR
jgi:pimeloyl-ACP methyl ester carboxylesterase